MIEIFGAFVRFLVQGGLILDSTTVIHRYLQEQKISASKLCRGDALGSHIGIDPLALKSVDK